MGNKKNKRIGLIISKLGIHPKMRAVAKFLATAFALYIGWYIFQDYYLSQKTDLTKELIVVETKFSTFLLDLLPLKDHFSANGAAILCNGKKALIVGEECNGLVLFVLFAGFIIAFPGNWRSKLWYIPFGIAAIFIVNILRMVVLTINFKYYHSSFAFNHHVTFTYLVYSIIFLLWIVWVNKFSKKTSIF